MNHAHNQKVDLHWQTGKNLGLLLIEAAGLVDKHDGYAQVSTNLDYETGDYEVNVYVYS